MTDRPGEVVPDPNREGGYVKIHRRLESSAVWQALRADQCWVTLQLLLMANWKPAEAGWHGRLYRVERGELAHTLETIASRAKVSIKVVRSTLEILKRGDADGPFVNERFPFSGTGPGTGPRILKIVNYDRYQGDPDDSGHGIGHGPGTDQAQREEGEEGEEEKNGSQEGQGKLLSLPRSEKPRPEPSTMTGKRIREIWPDIVDPDALLHRLHEAYPNVDLRQAVQDAWCWEQAEPPSGRKKAHERFLTNWVRRAGAHAPRRGEPQGQAATPRRIFEGLDADGKARYRA